MRKLILILFCHLVFQLTAQQTKSLEIITYQDSLSLGDTLTFVTSTAVWSDNIICSPLINVTDSLINNELFYDLTFNFTPKFLQCLKKDTFQHTLFNSGTYNLICFYNWVDSVFSPPTSGTRIASDTISFIVRNITGLKKNHQNTFFSVFPSPVKNILNVNYNIKKHIEKIEVWSLKGHIVKTSNIIDNQINVSNLASGMYFLRIYSENEIETFKIVKE